MKKCQVMFVSTLILLGLIPAWGANSVVVESKSASASETAVTVGVYIENDVGLSAVVLPLVIRQVTVGAFISDTLYMQRANRFTSHLTGYQVTSYLPVEDNEKPWQCGGGGFSTRGQVDFISPDAMLHVSVLGDPETDACLPVGDDGAYPEGTPSLTLTFGVTGVRGSFVIDTTCVTPGNHILFVDSGVPSQAFTPTFTRGIIEIGGPFWHEDTITGHIETDLVIEGEVRVTGDLTIDSGVTLTLLRGSQLTAIDSYDDQASGNDTGLVEVIVRGTLTMDTTDGPKPMLKNESDSSGTWYGIRIMPGGRFETGIGAVIEDGVIGVSIAKGAPTDTLSGLTLRNCDSIGIWNAASGVALRFDSVYGLPSAIGIYSDSSAPLIESCHVESCGTGIRTRFSASTIRTSKVLGPGDIGIKIDNGGGLELEGGKQRGPRVPAQMAEVQTSTVTLHRDTVSGYFSQAQLWMENFSSRCNIDSCGFVHPAGSARSPSGLHLGWSDTVTVRRSTITGFETQGVYSFKSNTDLGKSTTTLGNNNIYSDTTGCGGCLVRRVTHVGTDSLKAEGNWWGANPPTSSWFSGKVDYNPYLTAPLGKISAPTLESSPADAVPRGHSLAQNYPNPFNSSTEIEFALASAEKVRVEVFNILGQRVKTLANGEFPEGNHRVVWNGTMDDGQHTASGVYLYRIVAGDFIQSKKMVLLK